MATSSLVGFGLTVGLLLVFLVVSYAQLGRGRKVVAGEITVAGRGAGPPPDEESEVAHDEASPGNGDVA